MVIINEGVFNAFVADGRRIFVNYGAMLQSETPNQIIGVLAHETGHLAGGHLAKLREQLAEAQTQMIIAMLLGAGAMVAGARGRRQQRPRQCRRGRDVRAGRSDPPHPALLCAAAGGKCRQGRGQVPDRDRPVRRGACTRPSSASPTRACSPRAAPIPTCSRTRCRPSASPRWKNWRAPAPIGTRRTTLPCSCATTWCAPRSRPSWSGRTPSTGAIRCRTPACRPAMRTPSRPIGTAICAARSPRSTH